MIEEYIKYKDIIGNKYGYWAVTSFNSYKGNGKVYYNCICNCGNEGVVRRDSLLRGVSTSCGCFKSEFQKEEANHLYGRRRAVIVKGEYFDLMISASEKYNISVGTIRKRCLSSKYTDYRYTEYRLPSSKICSKCTQIKNLEEFSQRVSNRDKHHTICKICQKKQRDNTLNKQSRWRKRTLAAYGLSLEEYNEIFNLQKGKCAICNIPQDELDRPLFVDHCHTTGKIRGLLCNKCNTGLGMFDDNLKVLHKAINYIIDN